MFVGSRFVTKGGSLERFVDATSEIVSPKVLIVRSFSTSAGVVHTEISNFYFASRQS
jgi:hypothetical protein